jgi:SatD family (SatD)
MTVAREEKWLAVVLGDVVASKGHAHRTVVQQDVERALDEINGVVPAVQPLEVTIGDEFQGAYRTLFDAIRVSLLVRLALLPSIDTRYGIGSGAVTIFDATRSPISQDGPAWWAARDAIKRIHWQQQRSGHERAARTWYIASTAGLDERTSRLGQDQERFVNAHLICRDTLVPRDDPRGIALLRGWLLGYTQAELANELSITQPAVSQRLARMGAFALRDAQELLNEADE